MSKRRYPLLRAVAELVNAANGVQPLGREGYITIPVFAFGWPTSEMSPLYLAVSCSTRYTAACVVTSGAHGAESRCCSRRSRGRCCC